MWKKRKKKQEDKFRDLPNRKIHKVFFLTIQSTKKTNISISLVTIYFFRLIYDGLFYIIVVEFSSFIKSVIGPILNILVGFKTTLVDIFQFSFINIKNLGLRAYLIMRRLIIKGRTYITINYNNIKMETWGQITWTISWSMNLKIINIHAYCRVVKVCK